MDAEVVVVGAGMAGLATAWRLSLAGRSPLVLERFALGHDRGSSHGATRIFRYAYADPVYVRMAQAALPLWRELGDVLAITGGLDVDEPAALGRISSALSACGAAFERLEPGALRARLPWLSIAGAGALYSPDYGVIAAARALSLMAAGIEVWEGAPAAIERIDDDGVTLGTPRGGVRARRCVVAAGAWTAPMLEPLGVRLPLRVTREQVFYFAGDAPLPFMHEQRTYVVPALHGAPGVKVAEHMTGAETTAGARALDVDPAGAARVRAYVSRALPGLDPTPVAAETCLYTTTPDEGFVIFADGPLVVASACSGHGFKFAPLIGEICAALVLGREAPVPLAACSPDRFR